MQVTGTVENHSPFVSLSVIDQRIALNREIAIIFIREMKTRRAVDELCQGSAQKGQSCAVHPGLSFPQLKQQQ